MLREAGERPATARLTGKVRQRESKVIVARR
jgi:hypothetical protein